MHFHINGFLKRIKYIDIVIKLVFHYSLFRKPNMIFSYIPESYLYVLLPTYFTQILFNCVLHFPLPTARSHLAFVRLNKISKIQFSKIGKFCKFFLACSISKLVQWSKVRYGARENVLTVRKYIWTWNIATYYKKNKR